MRLIIILVSISIFVCGCCKDDDNMLTYNPVESEISIETEVGTVFGSLNLPNEEGQFPVVLIIAGSGPTDRDGNNTSGLLTDSYKMISDFLAANGFASLRYDKRGVAKSYHSGLNEATLSFDDYVEDAMAWINQLKEDERFTKVIVLGHSEGALIGSIATNRMEVDGFISVAGTSQKADLLLLEQLASQPDYILNESQTIINSLNNGVLVPIVSEVLHPLFRYSVQPYLISLFQYDPILEMGKVNAPILVLHGTTDIQVKSSEAQSLADNNSLAEVVIVEGMNHVLKDASSNEQENRATYSNPNLPLSEGFSIALKEFVEKVTD